MDQARLLRLIETDEGPKLDFKMYLDIGTESTKKELTKDIIAIANSYGGRGHLVLGVVDKSKQIVGIDPAEYSEERIQQIILNRCDPPVSIRVEYFEIDGNTICLITVFRSHNRPHQMRQTGAFYIRRGSTTDYARRDEIAAMLQQNSLLYDELMPVYRAQLDHLDIDRLSAFVAQTTNEHYSAGREAILCDAGLVYRDKEDGLYYPTLGGLLLFGKVPQLILPHTGLTIAYTADDGQLAERQISGTIGEMLRRAVAFVGARLNGAKYSREAVAEAIANALVHRDYFDVSRQIVVEIDELAVAVTNPGALYDANINQARRAVTPKRRNNWLYHQLIILDNGQHFAHYSKGLSKIQTLAEPFGKVKFINMRKRNLFKVVIPIAARRKQ